MKTNKDYLYTEEVQIPSLGLLNEDLPEGIVTIRCIEIRDQKHLAGAKLLQSNKAVELLKRCVISPEDFDITTLTQVDLFFLLIKLRILSYGEHYKFTTRCPVCGGGTVIKVDLSELEVKKLEEFNPEELFVKLPRRKDVVYTKMGTQKDSDIVDKEVARLIAKFKGDLDGDPEVTLSIASIIRKIELVEPDATGATTLDNPIDILNYVEELTDLDAIAIQSTLDDIEFGVNPIVTDTCDKCNSEISVPLVTNAEFFRPRFGK